MQLCSGADNMLHGHARACAPCESERAQGCSCESALWKLQSRARLGLACRCQPPARLHACTISAEHINNKGLAPQHSCAHGVVYGVLPPTPGVCDVWFCGLHDHVGGARAGPLSRLNCRASLGDSPAPPRRTGCPGCLPTIDLSFAGPARPCLGPDTSERTRHAVRGVHAVRRQHGASGACTRLSTTAARPYTSFILLTN